MLIRYLYACICFSFFTATQAADNPQREEFSLPLTSITPYGCNESKRYYEFDLSHQTPFTTVKQWIKFINNHRDPQNIRLNIENSHNGRRDLQIRHLQNNLIYRLKILFENIEHVDEYWIKTYDGTNPVSLMPHIQHLIDFKKSISSSFGLRIKSDILGNNDLDGSALRAVAIDFSYGLTTSEFIKKLTSYDILGALQLHDHDWGPCNTEAFCTSLPKLTNLHTLTLFGNKFQNNTIDPLYKSIQSLSQLTDLTLAHHTNSHGDHRGNEKNVALNANYPVMTTNGQQTLLDQHALLMPSLLRSLSSLQSLDISYNQHSSKQLKHIAQALKGCTELQKLYIGEGNILETPCIKSYADYLKTNISLTSLNLDLKHRCRGFQRSDPYDMNLWTMLFARPSLQKLSLKNYLFSEEDKRQIIGLLNNSYQIEQLNITQNITDADGDTHDQAEFETLLAPLLQNNVTRNVTLESIAHNGRK